jgi:hypothetical protein
MFIIRVPSEGLELYQRLKEYMDYYNNDLCIQRINHQILNKQRFSGSKMIFRLIAKITKLQNLSRSRQVLSGILTEPVI